MTPQIITATKNAVIRRTSPRAFPKMQPVGNSDHERHPRHRNDECQPAEYHALVIDGLNTALEESGHCRPLSADAGRFGGVVARPLLAEY